jgi:hypothetical protein
MRMAAPARRRQFSAGTHVKVYARTLLSRTNAYPRASRQRRGGLGRPRAAGRLLLKADYPRAIDHYIDYFGGGPALRFGQGAEQRLRLPLGR